MRIFAMALLGAALSAQPLPSFLTQFLPKSGSPAVEKLNGILEALVSGRPRPYRFSVTEEEATQYLKQAIAANPGCGVSNPIVKFFPGNYVSFYFEVDLEQLGRFRPNWQRRLSRLPLRGKQTIWIDGRFWTGDGVFTAEAQKVRINGHYVSPALVNLGVRFLARWKGGRLNVVRGIQLPWGIKKIGTVQGRVSGEA